MNTTIVIDARPFIHNLTGVGTFLQSFIRSAQRFECYRFIILLPQALHPSVELSFNKNVEVRVCPLFGCKRIPRFIWFQTVVSYMLYRIKPDLFITPLTNLPFIRPAKTKTLAVVHDVVNIEFKDTMMRGNRILNSLLFKYTIEHADYLWANSHYTKGKILSYFSRMTSHDMFVGDAPDRALFKKLNLADFEIKSLKQQYEIEGKFILFVGSLEPRKNLEFLLNLMPDLTKYGLKLLVVGGKGWKNSRLKDLIDNNDIIRKSTVFPGYISNEELCKLYNIADAYVSTSLNEGFGMPQLEAMLCGCPVVSPYNSGMIEVVQGRGVTVSGWDKDNWIKAIVETVNTAKPNPDISEYDWDVICKRLFASIQF